ncbi:MAG: lipopolysaccharide biosynthesis protein [Bifidobacterium sp.]|uniref:rhamnan synthesis F family protein n=1 Tax=Bifidobacterium TaxID=1678 RepID=UPI00257ED237|nr:rhamnan synthesis F family protein [Bifidobacterium sp.]MBS5401011.1 lipopolysaccharide biosynthesis protein [Bifidobacterium sp.]
MAKSIDTANANRLGIYCFYDQNGHAARFIDAFLKALRPYLTDLIVVVNGNLDDAARKLFLQYSNNIIVRENVGLDAAAYRQVMLTLGWEKLSSYDEVICLNDTVMGPVFPFSEMFSAMDAKKVDFWGITTYEGGKFGNETIPTHLQAYWHAYRRSLIQSDVFQQYWEKMPVMKGYAEVTHRHEMRLTSYLEQHGFTWSSYVDSREFASLTSYGLLYEPVALIRDARCPVFKRRSFFVSYDAYFDQTAGQPALDLYDYLREYTDYDTDLIWDALLQAYNVADIRQAMHLDYVLPYSAYNPCIGNRPTSAFIFHMFFMDMLDSSFGYLANLPSDTDLYITTMADNVDAIKQYMRENRIDRMITFIPVKNRGRDVSALLVGARDVVTSGKYEIIGFAHDKKSSQNQENGHNGSETQGFTYKLFENTLGSKAFVENILSLFADNPRLGLLCPPPPFHALYFAHTLPTDWGPNFPATKELLEDRLGLKVPLDSTKPTMSAMGSCYWFRTDALMPLFTYQWSYDDFLPEGQMGADGSISHAIERANGYVAQSQGYYPAWVISDRYARIEMDSLLYTTNSLLTAIGEYRSGETLLATCLSLKDQIHRGHWMRKIRRGVHLMLKGITKRSVQKFPEPFRGAIYTVAWAPITTIRRLIGDIRQVCRKLFSGSSNQ